MQKNIYLVQANSVYGGAVYFPYATGSIAAYAFRFKEISENYKLVRFIYTREDIDEAISSLDNPYLVGFSNYIWNFEYNKHFAEKLKEKYPDCIITFGGHHVAPGTQQLEEYPYIDILTHGEGEEPFRDMLIALNRGESLENVPNISFRKPDGELVTTPFKAPEIDEYPSPYLDGLFDDILKDTKYKFSTILETNRGCPNKCAFCDWGHIKNKVRLFSMDRILKEIEWMGKNNIEYCYCADANFGLFERDVEIAKQFIETKKKYGFPDKLQATYAKTSTEYVFNINKLLNDAGMCKGATLSFQSMNEETLVNIGRKNMPLSKFVELQAMYSKAGIATYSELILGLPGETYETFKNGIDSIIESGQHMSINIFNCEVFFNAPIGQKDYMEKFGIKTARTGLHTFHCKPLTTSEIKEYSNIIVATNSMDCESWIKSNLISVSVRTFHNLGLLQCFAIYLFHERGIKYTDFYEKVLAFALNNPETVIGKVFTDLNNTFEEITHNRGSLIYYDEKFGPTTWPLEEGAFLQVVYEYEKFYDEINPLLLSYGFDKEFFDELLCYQKHVVKVPFMENTNLDFKYDFVSYFNKVYEHEYEPLKKKDIRIFVDCSDIPDDWKEYAKKTVWYGRRGGKNIRTEFEIEYI